MSKVEDKCSNIFVFQLPKPKNGEKILSAIKILAELTIFKKFLTVKVQPIIVKLHDPKDNKIFARSSALKGYEE